LISKFVQLTMNGSCFVWSQSEPYDDEMNIDFTRVKRWLRHFGLGTPLLKHCSGHISGTEIQGLIDRARPEVVIPIHTEKPAVFKDWHENVRILEKNYVLRI
jgi:ribonuclease J